MAKPPSNWPAAVWSMHCAVIGPRTDGPGSDEDRRFHVLALCGETGELANVFKKMWRGDFTFEERRAAIVEEMADVRICIELLARACGVDLDAACADKLTKMRARWPQAKDGAGDDRPAR
ncbi:MAG: hypothetical protein HY246_19255 [Proteobacteria bacterium]|nr:hypothetical protein [Pseudomonadota bacterium]